MPLEEGQELGRGGIGGLFLLTFVSEFNKFEFDTHTLPRSRFMYVIYRTIFLKIHDIMVESFKSFDIEHINKLGLKINIKFFDYDLLILMIARSQRKLIFCSASRTA